MEIPFIDLDALITSVLNDVKKSSEQYQSGVLSGQLNHDEYKQQTGILVGLELAAQILIQHARKTTHVQ